MLTNPPLFNALFGVFELSAAFDNFNHSFLHGCLHIHERRHGVSVGVEYVACPGLPPSLPPISMGANIGSTRVGPCQAYVVSSVGSFWVSIKTFTSFGVH